MKDCFSTYHPLVNFFYFAFVIGIAMFITHPFILLVGMFAAVCYSGMLNGIKKMVLGVFLGTLPLMVIVALMNPLFNHYGVTILCYLDNGNPVTLESIVYGLVMGAMLCQVVLWFSCYHKVMTSDKTVYLFGRMIPALSLVLSMSMRFLPRFKHRMEVIRNGQKCIGRDVSNGTMKKKVHHGITMLSILITWSLENAIDTADSMRARGYGTTKRTAFAIYRFDKRDIKMLSLMTVLAVTVLIGVGNGTFLARYNPRIVIGGSLDEGKSILCYSSYVCFAMIPMITEAAAYIRFLHLQRTIQSTKKGEYRLWNI